MYMKPEGKGFLPPSIAGFHTRHTFSAAKAKQPQACQTCHMGFDHPQWECTSVRSTGSEVN